ncbi:MAG: hypothetical protein QW733_01625 [Desulfurococcaceae archaeon]
MSQINWNELARILEELIKFYTSIHMIPITADNWEELVWATLAFMYGEEKIDWTPRSHRDTDIIVKVNNYHYRIGLKAGVIKRNKKGQEFLELSSFRLTTYEKLEDKLQDAYNRNKKNDFYLICGRLEEASAIEYRVYIIDSQHLFPSLMCNPDLWQLDSKAKKWVFTQHQSLGFARVEIIRKMSDQLWYEIPVKHQNLKELLKIRVNRRDLGKGLINYIKQKLKST